MAGIKTFLTNRLTWATVGFITLYWIVSHTIMGVSDNAEFWRTLNTTLALMAVVAFLGTATRAYKARKWPNEELIGALAVVFLAAQDGLGGQFQQLWRNSSFEHWIVNNRIYSFTVAIGAAGWLLMLVVPNFIGKGVSAKTRTWLITGWITVAIFSISMTYFSPDLTALAHTVRPWIIDASEVEVGSCSACNDAGSGSPPPPAR